MCLVSSIEALMEGKLFETMHNQHNIIIIIQYIIIRANY